MSFEFFDATDMPTLMNDAEREGPWRRTCTIGEKGSLLARRGWLPTFSFTDGR